MIRISLASLAVASSACLGSGAPSSTVDRAVTRVSIGEFADHRSGTLHSREPFTIAIEGRAFSLTPSVVKRVEATDAHVVRGGLDGEPGQFLLASVDGYVSGAIWAEDGAIEFRPLDENGLVEVVNIQKADLPGCLADSIPQNAPERRPLPDPEPSLERAGESSEQIVRVFVGISHDAVSQIGSESAALAVATASVESTNTAYANSLMTMGDQGDVTMSIELAGTMFIDGQGLDYSELLSALQSRGDGIMDEIHPMRDATKADLVALISRSGIGVCGVAYFATNNPNLGFSVTAHSCAVGNLTFAHELGHNFGASHDIANSAFGSTDYAYGWRWNTSSGALHRSVMSYSPGRRRPHFSNPDVFDNGGATGDAEEADNARFIGEASTSVARFRTGPVPPPVDCDGDGTLDGIQIATDPMLDLDNSGTLDTCDLDQGLLEDCNGEGTPDILEIVLEPSLDSNSSGVLDSCELDQGLLEDCNNDGIADIGQIRPRTLVIADPIVFGEFPPTTMTVLDDAANEIEGDVTLTLSADADLGAAAEYIDLFISGAPIGRFWELDGADCDPNATTVSVTFDAPTWNSFETPRVLSFTRPSTVDVASCSGSIHARVEYIAINRDFDANGDGVLDDCEPGCSLADLAQPLGVLDLADISAFVAAFAAGEASVDIAPPFGVFDLADVVAFVTAFSDGCD